MKINYRLMGKRVAAKRKQLKLTQAELAEKAGLTSHYISKIETSKTTIPSIHGVLKICKALGVTPDFLFAGIAETTDSEEYLEVAHKLKNCDSAQLQLISRLIDAATYE